MIRVQNIYHMLAYAFQVLREQGYRDIATEEFPNTAELCTAILIRGTNSQVKRGLGREYIDRTSALSTLRGKFEITDSVKTRSVLRRQMALKRQQRAQAGTQATAHLLRRCERRRPCNRELADALQSKQPDLPHVDNRVLARCKRAAANPRRRHDQF